MDNQGEVVIKFIPPILFPSYMLDQSTQLDKPEEEIKPDRQLSSHLSHYELDDFTFAFIQNSIKRIMGIAVNSSIAKIVEQMA